MIGTLGVRGARFLTVSLCPGTHWASGISLGVKLLARCTEVAKKHSQRLE